MNLLINNKGGGLAALSFFREVWLVDFEFQAPPGHHAWPVCMVAREWRSGRVIRLWRDELLGLAKPPFHIGTESLFVAYYASADLGCFMALGWPMPACILDLFAEHRCATNGDPVPCGNGLIGALALRGLAHIDAGEKDSMRRLAMERTSWSLAEQAEVLDYCKTDVDALAALLPEMASELDLPRALLRGHYMAAVARMEWTGIPIDTAVYERLEASWDTLKGRLIAARLAPADATKASHKAERDRCKAVVLGVNYGMGHESLAISLGIAPAEARELMRLHRETYRRFWSWSDGVMDAAMSTREMQTFFGWKRRVQAGVNPRALMNFPMQANGAEMMRIAAIAATEAGIEVCAPVHDAFLIQAPLERLDGDVARMRGLMTEAGRAVTAGFPVRTDATIVRYPDRYMDEAGKVMWDRVMSLLAEVN